MRKDWSETTKVCGLCHREVKLTRDGKWPTHFGTSASGRRQQCLRSGQNALTLNEIPRSTRRIR